MEQKKELIANMLKTGLFCAPPSPIHATAADEREMELVQGIRIQERTGSTGSQAHDRWHMARP